MSRDDGSSLLRSPERRGSDSIKWQRYAGRDVLPLWVADMDFAAPQPVLDALQQRIAHGVFGYAHPWPSLTEAVVDGIARHHGWQIEPDWLIWLPGVVTGFNVASHLAGEPGDGILAMTPVYPPFLSSPGLADRKLLRSDLLQVGESWIPDWEDLHAQAPQARMLMLCNPHNPVGRSWTRQELQHFAALAEQHDWVVMSDDIHCGLVLDPQRPYTPLALLDEDIARRTITLMAPSKTWNIPALYAGFAIIPDATLRRRYQHAMQGLVPHLNVLGLVAMEAAYREGDAWLDALITQLRDNAGVVHDAIVDMPLLATTPVEATYLAWLDCRGLAGRGIGDPAAFFEQHGVGLSEGRDFGAPGFLRLNFGCSPELLAQALQRMRSALDTLR
ncbi:MalY/PatB family protein [Uliginosibacterium sp. H1]|uniref:MalY/PatB family protein n=1 Tax=Uliginosibacterium sp. H1 TaxID=3114757 RepID=UPI002E17F061|nr:PatB family C-S lyase [Uliginosibacterium sp. H1]